MPIRTINIAPDYQNLAFWYRGILLDAMRKSGVVDRGSEREFLDTALEVIVYAANTKEN
jgi:hypothetical protein